MTTGAVLRREPAAGGAGDYRDRLAVIQERELSFLKEIDYSCLTEQPVQRDELRAGNWLDPERAAAIFRQMNLAFFAADQLRKTVDAEHADESQLVEIERLICRGEELRNGLAIVFTTLSYSIAKSFVTRRFPLDELVSEAQATLLYAISKFNPDRGFRFSTYATHAIRRCLTRFVMRVHNRPELTVDWQQAEPLELRRWSYDYEQYVTRSIRQIDILLSKLTARERYIVRSRFGWGRDFSPSTLQALADELGVSRERVRQVESRALDKLRQWAEAQQ